MLSSIKNALYKFGLYIPGGEKRLARYLKRVGTNRKQHKALRGSISRYWQQCNHRCRKYSTRYYPECVVAENPARVICALEEKKNEYI